MRDRAAQLALRDLPRFSLEATGLHEHRRLGGPERAAIQGIEQRDQGERGGQDQELLASVAGFLRGAFETGEVHALLAQQPAFWIASVEAAIRLEVRHEQGHHVAE